MNRAIRIGAVTLLSWVAVSAWSADAPRSYIVILKQPAAAVYSGGLPGLPRTRATAGARLDVRRANTVNYTNFLHTRRAAVLSSVPGARVVHEYSYALNGMSVVMTETQARKLKANSEVASVTVDDVRHLVTNRTPTFLGLTSANGLWAQRDTAGLPVKGEGMVIGMVDSGIWPEDLSFSDRVDASGAPAAAGTGSEAYGPPPAKWHGRCDTGPGFGATNCNDKLIGARVFHEGFDAAGGLMSGMEFDSARDMIGHGSHTSSIAAGNSNVTALIDGIWGGVISGMAPRARIAMYKVCWTDVNAGNGCLTSDSVAAIDQAVADGVDVINFSISGTSTDLEDPVEQAFLNAAEAGVFVATAAGNEGGNSVNHPSPWVTTVAASTTDKNFTARLQLGSGQIYRGASMSSTEVHGPLILAGTASRRPPYDDTNILARLCATNSLDPAKVAGKIVVCDRGTQNRTDKSAEVARAGGVGMVLVNVISSTDDVDADPHAVPTVHLPLALRSAVRAYASSAGAKADIGVTAQTPGLVAPQITSFSSRGPNLADVSVLKPDVAAPGANILAEIIPTISQSQHDAIAAGTLVGTTNAATEQGTSMASPHVAGVALLMRQLHPSLTPAEIRSMLITSASGVKLPDNSTDTDRFGYGAGQIAPNMAAATELAYDANSNDYQAYLCGLGLLTATSKECSSSGAIQGKDLNSASISTDVVGSTTIKRRITNVGPTAVHYSASATVDGFTTYVTPSTLALAPGQSQDVVVKLSLNGAAQDAWVFGALTWSSGDKQVISPIAARGSLFRAPALLSEGVASGSASLTVTTGFNGSLVSVATGLTPAVRTSGSVATGNQSCYPVTVPVGATALRVQLFDSETSNPGYDDLGIYLLNASGGYAGGSDVIGSNETFDVAAPSAGIYQACVYANTTKTGSTNFTMSSFVVAPSTTLGTLGVSLPSTAASGQSMTGTVSWSSSAAQRSLGTIQYATADGTFLGATLVVVDPVSIGKPAAVFGGKSIFK